MHYFVSVIRWNRLNGHMMISVRLPAKVNSTTWRTFQPTNNQISSSTCRCDMEVPDEFPHSPLMVNYFKSLNYGICVFLDFIAAQFGVISCTAILYFSSYLEQFALSLHLRFIHKPTTVIISHPKFNFKLNDRQTWFSLGQLSSHIKYARCFTTHFYIVYFSMFAVKIKFSNILKNVVSMQVTEPDAWLLITQCH